MMKLALFPFGEGNDPIVLGAKYTIGRFICFADADDGVRLKMFLNEEIPVALSNFPQACKIDAVREIGDGYEVTLLQIDK